MAATLKKGYRGLGLLIEINLDRLIVALALGGALFLAAWLGSS